MALAAAMAMTSMHEHMHKRTSEQREPDEKTEHMRSVLSEEKHAGDRQKSGQHQTGLGLHGHGLPCLVVMTRLILHRHLASS
ncbi:hypothetical protein A6X20_30420 [Bradyrhizobium elkanii]|nr:hypothetical protein A6X20_30420 [Bradyrhizobium elkanii]